MTTIAYRDGELAADSKCTAGGYLVGEFDKIIEVGPFLVGGCGDVAMIARYFEWLQKQDNLGELPPKPDESLKAKEENSYTILFVHKQTKALWQMDNGNYPHLLRAPFMAIGSGHLLAIGAMEMGATAKQAVEAAAKYDAYTGGIINVMKVA